MRHLPVHADRRRGAPRRVLRPLLLRGRRARGRRPRRSAWRRPASTSTPSSTTLFDELLQRRVDRLARRARGPRGARRGGHDLPHGHRGDARPHRPALHHRLQRAGGHAARLRRGLHATSPATSTATSRSARASCATWPARDPRYGEAIQRTLVEVAPVADGVLRPKWIPTDVDDDAELFGASVDETRAFALQALERRLKVIGLRGRRVSARGYPDAPCPSCARSSARRCPSCSGRGCACPARTVWRVAGGGRRSSSCSCWPGWSSCAAPRGRRGGRRPRAGRLQPHLHRRRCTASRRARARRCACRRAPGAPQSLRRAPAAPRRPTRATSSAAPDAAVGAPDRADAARTYPGFLWRGDGRVNINQQPGYQIVFQATHRRAHDLRQARAARARARPAAARRARHHDARRALAAIPQRRRGRRANGALKTPYALVPLRHRAAVSA